MTVSGPLVGVRIVELAGIGPAPMCAMLLADMGADVVRVDRLADAGLGVVAPPEYEFLNRSRRSIAIDLKKPEGVETVLRLVDRSDVLIEGFRPGVTERLGVGPEVCLARNPRLVYGRMTGWGQTGPLASTVGHDINFVALSGALHAIGIASRPTPPLNLVGDFGGGALYLAMGICAALLHARQTGQGQAVDAAMTDGATSLMTFVYGLRGAGLWHDARSANILDGAAPYYRCYETSDNRWMAVGAIEPKFYAAFVNGLGLDLASLTAQSDRNGWPALRERFAALFRTRTRDEWSDHFAGSDACVTPVLSLDEAPTHAHHQARETFTVSGGVTQPSPAPRFSHTPSAIQRPPSTHGADTEAVLTEWGFSSDEIATLHAAAVIAPEGAP